MFFVIYIRQRVMNKWLYRSQVPVYKEIIDKNNKTSNLTIILDSVSNQHFVINGQLTYRWVGTSPEDSDLIILITGIDILWRILYISWFWNTTQYE